VKARVELFAACRWADIEPLKGQNVVWLAQHPPYEQNALGLYSHQVSVFAFELAGWQQGPLGVHRNNKVFFGC